MASLNVEMAVARVGGDYSLFQELGRLFLEEYPKTLSAIRQSFLSQDRPGLEHHAHSMKGAAINFDATEVVEAARALELGARQKPQEELAAGLERLEAALERLDAELQTLTKS